MKKIKEPISTEFDMEMRKTYLELNILEFQLEMHKIRIEKKQIELEKLKKIKEMG